MSEIEITPRLQLAINCAVHRRLFVRCKLAKKFYYLKYNGYVDNNGKKIYSYEEDHDEDCMKNISAEQWTQLIDDLTEDTPASLHNILLECHWCDRHVNSCEHTEKFFHQVRSTKEYNYLDPVPPVEANSESSKNGDEETPPGNVRKRNIILHLLPIHVTTDRITKFFRKREMHVHSVRQLSVKNKKISYKVSLNLEEADKATKLQEVCGHKCRISLFQKKHEIPQCYSCNGYRHTAKECKQTPVCLFCGGEHTRRECKNKPSVKHCVSCGQDGHLATSRSCEVYKKLKASADTKKSPPSVTKKIGPTKASNQLPREDSRHTLVTALSAVTQALCLLLQNERTGAQPHRAPPRVTRRKNFSKNRRQTTQPR